MTSSRKSCGERTSTWGAVPENLLLEVEGGGQVILEDGVVVVRLHQSLARVQRERVEVVHLVGVDLQADLLGLQFLSHEHPEEVRKELPGIELR